MKLKKLFIAFTIFVIAIGCATSPDQHTTASLNQSQLEQLCTKCHTLDRVYKMQKLLSKEQMQIIVMEMSKKKDSGIHTDMIYEVVNEMY